MLQGFFLGVGEYLSFRSAISQSDELPPLVASCYVTPDRLEWPLVHFPPVHCREVVGCKQKRGSAISARAAASGAGFRTPRGTENAVGVYGSGFLGTVISACLADFGTPVSCCHPDRTRMVEMAQGNIPFFEKNLKEIIRRNVRAGRLLDGH